MYYTCGFWDLGLKQCIKGVVFFWNQPILAQQMTISVFWERLISLLHHLYVKSLKGALRENLKPLRHHHRQTQELTAAHTCHILPKGSSQCSNVALLILNSAAVCVSGHSAVQLSLRAASLQFSSSSSLDDEIFFVERVWREKCTVQQADTILRISCALDSALAHLKKKKRKEKTAGLTWIREGLEERLVMYRTNLSLILLWKLTNRCQEMLKPRDNLHYKCLCWEPLNIFTLLSCGFSRIWLWETLPSEEASSVVSESGRKSGQKLGRWSRPKSIQSNVLSVCTMKQMAPWVAWCQYDF